MAEYNTEICIVASLLPAEYVRHANSQHEDEPYKATDEVADVPVTVEYDEGWFQAGNRNGHPDTWEEDSGEDALVTAVTINDPDYSGEEELDLDGTPLFAVLVRKANEDQESNAGDNW